MPTEILQTSPALKPPAAATVPAGRLSNRVGSIDAYRGFVMLLMMAEVLELGALSRALPHSDIASSLAYHQSHVEWIGCSLHDLIQPSFSFLVGVALPFSLIRRTRDGQSELRRTLHAFWRAAVLVLLGVFLRSIGRHQTYWTFEDTLSQIGIGYGFLYLLANRSTIVQWSAFALILVGYWAAFALYPAPDVGSSLAATSPAPQATRSNSSISAEHEELARKRRDAEEVANTHPQGFAAHWGKNTNLAWAFDVWFLNLFPRENNAPGGGEHFTGNPGGYVTLSFIPTLATMILGLLAGGVLAGSSSKPSKIRWLLAAGVISLAAGWLLGQLGICPVVKRIWTPSWVLYSGGWCFLLLAGFYAVMDLWGARRWAFVLVVIGMNSIAAYMIAHLFPGFIGAALPRHLGHTVFASLGETYEHVLLGAGVLIVEWLILYGMYRRQIFLRI